MKTALAVAATAATAAAYYLYRRRTSPPPAVERLDRRAIAGRRAGHDASINVRAIAAAAATVASQDAAVQSWTYPQASKEPGVCSRKMAPEPFDAVDAARYIAPESQPPSETATLARLRGLRAVCAAVAERVGAEWCGVYQIVPPSAELPKFGGDDRAPNLLKLAYIGAPSRPLFPLTAAFAEGSNNSTVAMSGVAVVYHDVRQLPTDAPYYVCDGQVLAEACVPIFGVDGNVIGIMDCESFSAEVFRPAEALGVVLAACEQLGSAALLA